LTITAITRTITAKTRTMVDNNCNNNGLAITAITRTVVDLEPSSICSQCGEYLWQVI